MRAFPMKIDLEVEAWPIWLQFGSKPCLIFTVELAVEIHKTIPN